MAQLNNPEWRDYIDENTQLVIDLDTMIFMSASAQEVDVMTVTHVGTGEEWFMAKDVPEFERVCLNPEVREEGYTGTDKARWGDMPTGKVTNTRFKNKTAFFGCTKTKITGWLGDINEKQVIKGLPTYSREDFELTFNKKVTTNAGAAINSLKRKIQEVTDFLGIDNCVYLIGGGLTHRHDLKLPININKPDEPELGRYKGARGTKPLLLDDVREYAVRSLGAIDVTDTGIECDDIYNFYMNQSHNVFKKTGVHKYLGVSADKDACGYNGLLFNPYRDVKTKTWKHPVPYLIDGLGVLDLREGEVKGKGFLFTLVLICTKDACDNYYATRHAGIKFGDKGVYELLYDSADIKDALQRVYDKFQEWYPEGTQYTAWDGTAMDITALEWLEMLFTAAWMLRSRKDKTTFTSLMDYYGVSYEQ